MSALRIPQSHLAVYKSAELIHSSGPKTTAELYAAIYFGRDGDRAHKVTNSIAAGWLTSADGKIGIGSLARAHFDGQPEVQAEKYAGQVATVREPYAFDAPPLSKRFIPNAQGFRDDVPPSSVRIRPSFKSVAGIKQ